MSAPALRTEIGALLQRFFLAESQRLDPHQLDETMKHARAMVANEIGANLDSLDSEFFALRLRLALHLAPIEAIDYEPTNRTPRWKLVSRYLNRNFGQSQEISEPLARQVALTLRSWQEQRTGVTGYRDELISAQGGACAHCRVRFPETSEEGDLLSNVPRSLLEKDDFKPYFQSPIELLAPEVDHKLAISGFGRNDTGNLQVLCRLCNEGKGDGLGVDVRREARYAAKPVSETSVRHRANLLYATIRRDRGFCSYCKERDIELTVRKQFIDGTFVRSNLVTVCVSCCYS